MPTDKTNHIALNQLKEQYKDEIVEYEYKHWRESYQAPPPPRSYAQGMTRYRYCYKVDYIKLKDGRRIKVADNLDGVGWFIIMIFIILILVYITI